MIEDFLEEADKADTFLGRSFRSEKLFKDRNINVPQLLDFGAPLV